MKKRRTKLFTYLVGILLLSAYLIYANGYRWSAASLTRDLDHSIHFSPSVVVYQQNQGSHTVVVSQSDNWILCRSLNRVLPFLWKDEGLALTPVDLNQVMIEKTYSEILSEVIQSCSELSNETLILEDTYKLLDAHRAQFLEAGIANELILTQESRTTVVLDDQILIDQSFTNSQLTLHFYWTKTGVPRSISIHWNQETSAENRIKAWELISTKTLSGWGFSIRITQEAVSLMKNQLSWELEDESVRIHSINGNVTITYKQ